MKITTCKVFFAISFLMIFLFLPTKTAGRENITDWYIKNYDLEIIVNKDSSLNITENITADCDNLPNKHGIFRILPTQTKTEKETIQTPVKLISITDFNDKPLNYETINSRLNHTITYKIGDKDKTVQGENYYKIKYTAQNAIRFSNSGYDEFYWNLNGNFWDLETDQFNAKIIFPKEISENNTEKTVYGGFLGSKENTLSAATWEDNILEVTSMKTLAKKQGITASVTFPKNIFTPYQFSFWQKYGEYFAFIIPVLIFIFCFLIWLKYGNDPNLKKTIVPEFGIPENINPLKIGLLQKSGHFSNNLITATIINLAVKGYIKIEKLDKKWLLGSRNYKLIKTEKNTEDLEQTEKIVLENIFKGENSKKLSDLKDEFYKNVSKIKNTALKELEQDGLIKKSGLTWQVVFIVLGTLFIFLTICSFAMIYPFFGASLLISTITLIIFAIIIPKRTQKGTELFLKIEGFKLYMETAEKYRQKYNEKENIFEKFLPYAIVFGIVNLWIKQMEKIYGKDYYAQHHPIWFYGAGISSFSASDFNSAINNLSSSISASTGTSSGAGGTGGAGGGGGGGGGGGW